MVADEVYGIIFRSRIVDNPLTEILLVKGKDGLYTPPGGPVRKSDLIRAKDETWIRLFLSEIVEKQTGISRLEIIKKVQPMPAIYRAYSGTWNQKMQSCIIIGNIYQEPTKGEVMFASFWQIAEMAKSELISQSVFRLCARAFASRDNHDEESRKAAAEILHGLHSL